MPGDPRQALLDGDALGRQHAITAIKNSLDKMGSRIALPDLLKNQVEHQAQARSTATALQHLNDVLISWHQLKQFAQNCCPALRELASTTRLLYKPRCQNIHIYKEELDEHQAFLEALNELLTKQHPLQDYANALADSLINAANRNIESLPTLTQVASAAHTVLQPTITRQNISAFQQAIQTLSHKRNACKVCSLVGSIGTALLGSAIIAGTVALHITSDNITAGIPIGYIAGLTLIAFGAYTFKRHYPDSFQPHYYRAMQVRNQVLSLFGSAGQKDTNTTPRTSGAAVVQHV